VERRETKKKKWEGGYPLFPLFRGGSSTKCVGVRVPPHLYKRLLIYLIYIFFFIYKGEKDEK
jgi:hypothetical protein